MEMEMECVEKGLDVQSQLEDNKCPLLRRVGNFAAALRMKKSWHGELGEFCEWPEMEPRAVPCRTNALAASSVGG